MKEIKDGKVAVDEGTRVSKEGAGTTKSEESEYCVPTPDFDADNY